MYCSKVGADKLNHPTSTQIVESYLETSFYYWICRAKRVGWSQAQMNMSGDVFVSKIKVEATPRL